MNEYATQNIELAAKDEEIERLKAQHEEMLLKHAREQGVGLEALEAALNEIARLKAEGDCMTEQAIHFRDMAQKQASLLLRAADALGDLCETADALQWDEPGWGEYHSVLIAELRKAAG